MRTQEQYIDAVVIFIPETIKGRKVLPSLNTGAYRPHIRIDGEGEFIGVSIFRGPVAARHSVLVHVQLGALYYPKVDYTFLKVGTQFTVVEGYRIVAIGQVVKALYTLDHEA